MSEEIESDDIISIRPVVGSVPTSPLTTTDPDYSLGQSLLGLVRGASAVTRTGQGPPW